MHLAYVDCWNSYRCKDVSMQTSIVLELQHDALSSSSDILALLRKAHLIARKLGLKDFQEWVDNELNGYKNTKDVPAYRNLRGELKAWNPYHGWIVVVIPDDDLERTFSQRKVTDPIASLKSLLDGPNATFASPISGDGCKLLGQLTGFQTKYTLQISPNAISNIIEQVKNKVLDWSIVLEENGILGEGLSFTKEEKAIAQSEPKVVNYISNFWGNVSETQIQQGTEGTVQTR